MSEMICHECGEWTSDLEMHLTSCFKMQNIKLASELTQARAEIERLKTEIQTVEKILFPCTVYLKCLCGKSPVCLRCEIENYFKGKNNPDQDQ